jgi:hypothetical protein
MSDNLHSRTIERVQEIIGSDQLDAAKLAHVIHLLGKYRSELLKGYVISRCGRRVQSGPFAGLEMPERVAEGCSVPKLLGCYEAELHAIIEELRGRNYEVVLNVGCAEGYYAAGFARLWPQVEVHAFDDNAGAQRACRETAHRNGVESRVHVQGHCAPDDVARLANRRLLIWCDIEGMEMDLLDPHKLPELRRCDIVVEVHDLFRAGSSAEMVQRFEATHHVRLIRPCGRDPNQFSVLHGLPDLDRWLAVWEWRSGPTPWAVMMAHRRPSPYPSPAAKTCGRGEE